MAKIGRFCQNLLKNLGFDDGRDNPESLNVICLFGDLHA